MDIIYLAADTIYVVTYKVSSASSVVGKRNVVSTSAVMAGLSG